MFKRLCAVIAQTYAVSIDGVLEEAKQVGIDAVVRNLEEFEQNTPNFK